MKQKLQEKYLKQFLSLFITICLTGTMIGLYFIQQQQFVDKDYLDFLVSDYNNFRWINWLSLASLAMGWIAWEWARSKSGKKIVSYIAISLTFIALLLTMNLISFIFGSSAILAMIAMTYLYISKNSKMEINQLVKEVSDKQVEDTKKLKSKLKIK